MERAIDILRHISGWIRQLYHFEHPGGFTRIELRQPLILAAFLVSLLWYLISPSRVITMVTGGLGSMLVFGYLWANQMARKVTAGRRLRYSAFQVGDVMEEQIFLANDSFLPVLWAEFRDHSNIPSYSITAVQAGGANDVYQWSASTVCEQRGLYILGPWEIIVGEPFGIFVAHQVYTDESEVLVYPPLAALPDSLLPHSNAPGNQRILRQPLASETIQSVTTRPYVPGDPLRRLHWRTTARRNSPYVKIFEPEASATAWIVPDFDSAAHFGDGPDSTLERMVILVASLAARMLQANLAVGVLINASVPGRPGTLFSGNKPAEHVEDLAKPAVVLPQSGRPHLWNILRAISPAEAAPIPYAASLALAGQLVSSQDMLIAVTPSTKVEWAQTLKRLVPERHSSHARAILLDPGSFGASRNAASGSDELVNYLAAVGIPHMLVTRDEIQPVPGSHGALRRWEFKTLATGKVIVSQAPREVVDDQPMQQAR